MTCDTQKDTNKYMSKIGILFTSFGMQEYLEAALTPWIQAREQNLNGYEFIISAVSIPFKEYKDINSKSDDTVKILNQYKIDGKINYLTTAPLFVSEAEGRSIALLPLQDAEVEIVILFDGDEIITLDQISNILNFVKLDRFTSWFRFSYKNYVFTEKQYLSEPFTPPRLFRTKTNGYTLDRFRWDNDLVYKGTVIEGNAFKNKYVDYLELPSKTIPASVAHIRHYSWISNERSKNKCLYQQSHFGGICSYKWNYDLNRLEFNEEYYKSAGQSIPEILQD